MRICFAGGGSGGHFYPIIAIAQAIREESEKRRLISVNLYYLAPEPYDEEALFNLDITYHRVPAGKLRRYASLKNISDMFGTAAGIVVALWRVFTIYPDVVFSKGGYASFPVVLAARILRIPVFIHESDAAPGIVNRWAGKFARRIAVSFADAAEYFPEEKVAHTGNPIRREIRQAAPEGAHEFLELSSDEPTVCILSGSQGAETINNIVLDALPQILERYQLIHQTGENHYEAVTQVADVALEGKNLRARYKPFPYLNPLALRMAAGAASIIVTRAGSTIFEIAAWGTPAIVIPLPNSGGDHQRKNAFAYARTGAATVVEQDNLTPHILLSEIDRIMNDPQLQEQMREATAAFSKLDAADVIGQELLEVSLEHTAE